MPSTTSTERLCHAFSTFSHSSSPWHYSMGVFRDYSSAAEILDAADNYDKACPSEIQVLEVIHVKESMLETPVLRQSNGLDIKKSSGKARGADAFGKAFVELGHRSGYVRNVELLELLLTILYIKKIFRVGRRKRVWCSQRITKDHKQLHQLRRCEIENPNAAQQKTRYAQRQCPMSWSL